MNKFFEFHKFTKPLLQDIIAVTLLQMMPPGEVHRLGIEPNFSVSPLANTC